jgi:hypothetical protein
VSINRGQLKIHSSEKEHKMNKNHFFNIVLAATLALMVALTLQGAIETASVAMANGGADQVPSALVCDKPAVESSSIRRVYVEQLNTWLTYTNSAPTGVDGGLIDLLSNTRVCSK